MFLIVKLQGIVDCISTKIYYFYRNPFIISMHEIKKIKSSGKFIGRKPYVWLPSRAKCFVSVVAVNNKGIGIASGSALRRMSAKVSNNPISGSDVGGSYRIISSSVSSPMIGCSSATNPVNEWGNYNIKLVIQGT